MALKGEFRRNWQSRQVPLGLFWRMLFGGAANQVGWGLLGFGMIFFWGFAMEADVASIFRFKGLLEKANGVVTQVWKTSYTIGGSKGHSGTPIFGCQFKFMTPNEKQYTGQSYATGQRVREGDKVAVEYPAGRPGVARVVGMRSKILGAWGALLSIVPLIGALLLFFGIRGSLRSIRLLKTGRLTEGTLISSEPTNTRVNGRVVFRYVFEFEAEDGNRYRATARTHRARPLAPGTTQHLLYDPENPDAAAMLGSLPAWVEFDGKGEIAAYSGSGLVWIVPMVVIVGHGIYVYLRYLK